MKKIVKIILVFIMAVYLAIALTSVINGAIIKNGGAVEQISATAETARESETDEQGFIIKTVNGKIAVQDIKTGKITRITDTRVSSLTEEDRARLDDGIKVSTESGLRRALEDFCS